MKRFKFLSVLFLALSAVAFTSCLDDDDNDSRGLTPQEVQTAFDITRGSHSGNLIYAKWDYDKNANSKPDTLSGSWSINTDSTMTFRNVPSEVIASCVSDSTLRDAIAEQAPVNINAYIGYISLDPVQWLINPSTVTYSNLSYNGGTHKVSIVFAVNSSFSYGQAVAQSTASPRKQQMQIIAAGLYVDDKLVDDGINYANIQRSQRIRALMFIEK